MSEITDVFKKVEVAPEVDSTDSLTLKEVEKELVDELILVGLPLLAKELEDLLSSKHDLLNTQNASLAGRNESDLPLHDEYWKVRADVQQKMHVVDQKIDEKRAQIEVEKAKPVLVEQVEPVKVEE